MKLTVILAVALPVLATACAAKRAVNSTATSALEQGMWTGVMSFVDEGRQHRLGAIYDVSVKGDSLAIVMNADGGSFPFSDVKLIDDKLTFWVSPGARAHCTLTRRDDGAFEGRCLAEGIPPEASTLRILMLPPPKD